MFVFSSQSLDLSGCGLQDYQAIELLDNLSTQPQKFRFIDLSDNFLTDVTAKKIAEVMIKMPTLCQIGWLGSMIKICGNPISIEGLRACFAAMKETERQPDFIVFSYHSSISDKDWRDLNKDYFEMRKKHDPIVRLKSCLSSFFN